jgi:ElaA protein
MHNSVKGSMLKYIISAFDELTPRELYAILQLRNIVFAVEQNCVYPDMDDRDQLSFHLMGWKDNKLLAYTRLIPPGVAFAEPSIGRVVTSPLIRRTGEGRELMARSIAFIHERYKGQPIRIGAQVYLQHFYSSLGFVPTGESYLEDGIEHIEMLLG